MLNPNKKQNIFITGMMGTGKTTFGSLVAKKLVYEFVDTDVIIEENTNMTINKIFKTKGEEYFRNLEHELLKEIVKKKDQVVATGGGMLIDKKNMKLASENGLVIYLHTPLNEIHKRIARDNKRPLLHGGEVIDKITEIFDQRKSIYNTIPCSIDSTSGDKEEVVDYMINEFQKWLRS